MTEYVVVIERIRRARSCFIYTMKPTRFLWWAKFKLWLRLQLMEIDCNWVITTPERAKQLCDEYKNWRGENRVGA